MLFPKDVSIFLLVFLSLGRGELAKFLEGSDYALDSVPCRCIQRTWLPQIWPNHGGFQTPERDNHVNLPEN